MEYVITFSDVMAAVITLGIGVLGFLIRGWLKTFQKGQDELKDMIRENDCKINERVDSLETETDKEIASIKNQLNDIKGDFATTFVLREDFFRSMNGVEDRVKSIDSKIDRLLLQSK